MAFGGFDDCVCVCDENGNFSKTQPILNYETANICMFFCE